MKNCLVFLIFLSVHYETFVAARVLRNRGMDTDTFEKAIRDHIYDSCVTQIKETIIGREYFRVCYDNYGALKYNGERLQSKCKKYSTMFDSEVGRRETALLHDLQMNHRQRFECDYPGEQVVILGIVRCLCNLDKTFRSCRKMSEYCHR